MKYIAVRLTNDAVLSRVRHGVLLVRRDLGVLPLFGLMFSHFQVERRDFGVRSDHPFNQIIVRLVPLGTGFEVRIPSQAGDLEHPTGLPPLVLCPAGVVAVVLVFHISDGERVSVAGLGQASRVVGQLHLRLEPFDRCRRMGVDVADKLDGVAGLGVVEDLLHLHLGGVLNVDLDGL